MWFVLSLIVGYIVYQIIDANFNKNSKITKMSAYDILKAVDEKVQEIEEKRKKEREALKKTLEVTVEEPKKETQHIVNNFYIQNNTYIQQNNYKSSKSAEANKDHTEKVWNRMGYRLKYGETYAYKYYGKEIFRPEQAERASAGYKIRYSEDGLTKKLLRDTGSAELTKKILEKEYGVSSSKAQKLIAYNG